MSEPSIPVALDPQGHPTPIEEAERRPDHYRCPECKEFVTARIGPQRQYFAHKQGVLDDTDCSLSSREDVERMVDELRTSDIEEGERERTIRVYIGEQYDDGIECFGILPSLEWAQLPSNVDVDAVLDDLTITASGVTTPPVPTNFHPSESETVVPLDPTADEYVVDIEGPQSLGPITGRWTADGLSDGDLFVGDQSRARRHHSGRQIKEGEWVYLLTLNRAKRLPDVVEAYDFGPHSVLAFPARESTEELLEEFGEDLTTDDYGFDADVILPPGAHPTVEAPIHGDADDRFLVGITPADGIDPIFEVVPIPKSTDDPVTIDPTGPGNPRFYATGFPSASSKRRSTHQRNSNRHRLVHLHPESRDEIGEDPEPMERSTLGLQLAFEGGSTALSPLDEDRKLRVDEDFSPDLLPSILTYVGPPGLEIEVTATFVEQSPLGPTLTRFSDDLEAMVPEIVHWVKRGCRTVRFEFGGVGAVALEFPQPSLGALLNTDASDPETSTSP